jgi:hypothetical protein
MSFEAQPPADFEEFWTSLITSPAGPPQTSAPAATRHRRGGG